MDRPTVRARAQYRFDNWMSRGTIAIMALLGAATGVFVLVIAAVAVVLRVFPDDGTEGDFWDLAWGNLMRTLDPGTMGGDAGWGFRILMLVVTVGGLVIVASLIGIVSGAFDDKMAELRKGRSRVLERDHTLLLGWSSKLLPIVAELCVANESRKRGVIVVLADRDKVEMEEAIREHVPRPGRTTIVCRRGDPMSTTDVLAASPQTARSIVILPPDDGEDPDAAVIKTALALTHDIDASAAHQPRIVAELRERRNLEAVRLLGTGREQWVLAGELITRMTVQTARQRGLSSVYTELLDFDGDEIYSTHQPQLAGLPYAEVQLRFDGSVVIGLERDGVVRLNPPADEALRAEDRVIVIAEDDLDIRATDAVPVDPRLLSAAPAPTAQPENTLILGCNASVQMILDELSEYVAPGSKVLIGTDVDPAVRVPPGLVVDYVPIDTTHRADLDLIDIVEFDHVLVLAYRDRLSPQAADAKTLVTLLHLRDIADAHAVELNVVTEMLDDRNRELAEVTKADDFIITDRLISLMLSQISENDRLTAVFTELFSSAGTEIYLKPAGQYVVTGEPVEFAAVVAAASRRGETAIGYRVAADAHARDAGYGVRVNPHLTARHSYAPGDEVIVLADHSSSRVAATALTA